MSGDTVPKALLGIGAVCTTALAIGAWGTMPWPAAFAFDCLALVVLLFVVNAWPVKR